ncbi:MerR family transcriptional regulator [Cellulomonas fengjieae]|uniref:MerR family transcriptional regulator n=1 Tax=Cellulomonas fengjieae TaxID=2819978 RepID=A0ABS3SCY5_9CELL|nr:MerR family transcriptional regulator [Cellulomonas fengjieae]MBO3083613.1 MerR family transcriptional regulator [Cellulomonas fengjieae]MBO3101636.1 MerR family transcriptional regulator [Cellulomonas fengjieae]QVI65070.1 MerR family transcriptional regulator [Cellulomonas fengjieae]
MVTSEDDEAALSQAPALTVAAVARRLGVAPATLRTWDRRYGLGPSEHSAGAHRRYSATDVDRLLVMRRLTLDGVAPAESARIALATDAAGGPRADAHPVAPSTPSAVVDAALAGDLARCARLLGFEGQPDVALWWTGLVEPVLAALARRTVVDPPGVDAVAAVHAGVLAALRARTFPLAGARRPVVLVLVAPQEARPLVAHAIAGALAAQGVDARIVGGPMSVHHAAELVAMTRPRAVITLGERVDPELELVERLARDQPDLPQFVMVPDAAAGAVPLGRSVHRARTFTGLLHEVLSVASAGEEV